MHPPHYLVFLMEMEKEKYHLQNAYQQYLPDTNEDYFHADIIEKAFKLFRVTIPFGPKRVWLKEHIVFHVHR